MTCEIHLKAVYKAERLFHQSTFNAFSEAPLQNEKKHILLTKPCVPLVCIDSKSELLKYCLIRRRVLLEPFNDSRNRMSSKACGLKMCFYSSYSNILHR